MGVGDGSWGGVRESRETGQLSGVRARPLQSTLKSRLTRALQLPDTGHVVLYADWPQKPPGWLIRFIEA